MIFLPRMTIAEFSVTGPPRPSISVAPTSTVAGVVAFVSFFLAARAGSVTATPTINAVADIANIQWAYLAMY